MNLPDGAPASPAEDRTGVTGVPVRPCVNGGQPERAPSGSTLLAIDPGDKESAYALIDVETRRPLEIGKVANFELLGMLMLFDAAYPDDRPRLLSIEMISSYGMAVGKEVFETCVWIGRYQQASAASIMTNLTYRRDVKLHHCRTTKATDANISQALKDRFAPGESNHGKGTKANPGWFFGFYKDVWQAYALAVQQADVIEGYEP